jgi:hypothetical protein
MTSYADTYLGFASAEAMAWVYANISPLDVCEFARFWQTRDEVRLWNVAFPERRPIKTGSLWWPQGAARWAVAHFLVDDTMLESIRPQIYDANTSGHYRARTLTMDDETNSIDTDLWMLPPRPLSQVPGWTEPGMWLMCLVDERYFWWAKSASITLTAGTTTWAQLYALIGTALSITINVDTVASAYLKPPAYLASSNDPLPVLLDNVALACGQRIVRKLDGTVVAQNVATAKANQTLQIATWSPIKQAGGLFALTP